MSRRQGYAIRPRQAFGGRGRGQRRRRQLPWTLSSMRGTPGRDPEQAPRGRGRNPEQVPRKLGGGLERAPPSELGAERKGGAVSRRRWSRRVRARREPGARRAQGDGKLELERSSNNGEREVRREEEEKKCGRRNQGPPRWLI